jgi:Na+-translocating ferredoxin:NAD+ oxidoreductase RnfE subunit
MDLSRTAAAGGRRAMSTGGMADGGGAAAGGLVAAVGTTFVTYMTADFLSNFLQHPTQRVRILYYILVVSTLYFYVGLQS